jgi:hypothetical protein
MLGVVTIGKTMPDGSIIVHSEKDKKQYRVNPSTLKPGAKPGLRETAGVGVVKGGNDPRYVMATAGDQNDVDGNTLNQEMQAYGLVGRASPGGRTRQRPVKGSIGRGKK